MNKQRVTVKEVAKRANVSLGTVSNVLNEPSRVAKTTRDRVLKAIEETGFVRNTAARQLRGAGSKAVGIVVLDSSNPFFTEIIRGAEDALREEGYVLIACSTDESQAVESQYLSLLEEHRVEGILITPSTKDLSRINALTQKGLRVVLVDRKTKRKDICSVTVDDVYGGTLAVEHLISKGHRRILFINGPQTIRQCYDRRAGVLSAIEKHRNIDPDVTLLEFEVPSLTLSAGENASLQVLSCSYDFTAIICANDLLALGVIRTCSKLGVKIPKDLALVGYDDITFASMVSPSLTSVRQPQQELGSQAAQLLLDELREKNHKHQEVRFSPTLIPREST